MTSLSDFAARMRGLSAQYPERANKLAIRTAETILGELVQVTPVDTSQALSNWQVGVGTPISASVKPFFPGAKGSTQGASSAEALAEGRRRLATKRPGQTIYLSNVLPYIQRLNDGSSSQAPAGFVERAVILGRRFLARAKF